MKQSQYYIHDKTKMALILRELCSLRKTIAVLGAVNMAAITAFIAVIIMFVFAK